MDSRDGRRLTGIPPQGVPAEKGLVLFKGQPFLAIHGLLKNLQKSSDMQKKT